VLWTCDSVPAMIRKLTLVSVAVVLAFASGACKSQASDSSVGSEVMGTFTCRDLKNDVCLGPSDRFEPTVPVVHMTYKTKDIPKNGDVYVIQWIAEDVGQAAPANTVIGTLNEHVKDVVPGLKNYVVNSRLTKPTNGWPVGKYRIDVKLADKTQTTARFAIQ
jgi:hypothetical protein